MLGEFNFIPCNPKICGGFAQNAGNLQISGGVIRVYSDGHLEIRVGGVADQAKVLKTNAAFDLYFGSFTPQVAHFARLGTVTTDMDGNITASLAQALPGGPHAGSFVLNFDNRSQFITGFTITGGPPPQETPQRGCVEGCKNQQRDCQSSGELARVCAQEYRQCVVDCADNP
jgi:hypothetical protein